MLMLKSPVGPSMRMNSGYLSSDCMTLGPLGVSAIAGAGIKSDAASNLRPPNQAQPFKATAKNSTVQNLRGIASNRVASSSSARFMKGSVHKGLLHREVPRKGLDRCLTCWISRAEQARFAW